MIEPVIFVQRALVSILGSLKNNIFYPGYIIPKYLGTPFFEFR